jgi:murein hydrolase activator
MESGKARERNILQEMDGTQQKAAVLEGLVLNQQRQIALLTDSTTSLQAAIGPQEQNLAQLGSRILTMEDEQHRLADVLARSLLTERRMNQWSTLEMMLGARSWREFLARRSLLKRLQTTSKNTISSLAAAVDTLQVTENDIFTRTHKLREQKSSIESKRQEAEAARRNIQQDLRELSRTKTALRSGLNKVRKDRKLLTERRQEIAAAQARIEEFIGKITRTEPLPGVSLESQKGRLPWPVPGRIVERFGLVRNRDTYTVTENPGIELSANAMDNVIAVADGEVSSVTWLRGFGNVCIVEHPGSYYTVYAKLGQVSVRARDRIQAGAPLGSPGYDAAADEYRVHFELWAGKEKKNPSDWLHKP